MEIGHRSAREYEPPTMGQRRLLPWPTARFLYRYRRIDHLNSCRFYRRRERMYRLGQAGQGALWVALSGGLSGVPQDRICFRACVTAKHTRS